MVDIKPDDFSAWALVLLLVVINISCLSVVVRPVYVRTYLRNVLLITGTVYQTVLISAVFIVLNVLLNVLNLLILGINCTPLLF